MRVLVAIPVYNEERYLPRVLSAVRRYAREILVIDDGSTDETAALLRGERDLHTLTHATNRGYGKSLIDAFAFAMKRGYDWVITIDCDEQHEPGQIPEFVRAARRNRSDIVSGSRYLVAHPDDDEPPADRRQINRAVTELLRQLLDLPLTDSFCGFKAHRVAALRRLALDEPGYAFPLQFWVQCVRAGLRVEELPVHRVYRDETRQFGGRLNDPAARLQHYLEVLTHELRRPATRVATAARACERSACE